MSDSDRTPRDKVRDQYEAYPSPSRDPADEARRLVVGSPSNLLEINHYLFAGRPDFTKPVRALLAGGGPGHAPITPATPTPDVAARRAGAAAAGGGGGALDPSPA